jgi:hypothetical protein
VAVSSFAGLGRHRYISTAFIGEEAPGSGDEQAPSDNPSDRKSPQNSPSDSDTGDSMLNQPEFTEQAREVLKKAEGQDTVPAFWDEFFSSQRINPRLLAEIVFQLHQQKRYAAGVECLLSSLRNDHAAPWTYDVLAGEMRLAKYPSTDIDRVLQSRVDFAPGDVSQMMLTAAMLSRLESSAESLQMCRRVSEMAPEVTQNWLLARSIADRFRLADEQVWSRLGILRHVWDDGYQKQHEEAISEVRRLIREAESDSPERASRYRSELAEAVAVDLRVRLIWSGQGDLDLMVTEPDGNTCSYRNRATPSGGRLIAMDSGHSGNAAPRSGGASGKHLEDYVCPTAIPGQYSISVRFISGKVVAGKAVVEIIERQATAEESVTRKTISLSKDDVILPVTLSHGRGKVFGKTRQQNSDAPTGNSGK